MATLLENWQAGRLGTFCKPQRSDIVDRELLDLDFDFPLRDESVFAKSAVFGANPRRSVQFDD